MRMMLALHVPGEGAEAARARWIALGGSEGASMYFGAGLPLVIQVPDAESADGKALETLAAELGASPAGPVTFTRTPQYTDADVDAAELLLLDAGSYDRALDPASLVPPAPCPECGLPTPVRSADGGLKLKGKSPPFDLFRVDLLWVGSEKLVEALAGFTGLELKPLAGDGPFKELLAGTSLGYPVDGTSWSEPCSKCGRRRGLPGGQAAMGYHAYPRSAWSGEDFVRSELYPQGLFVTQRVWKALQSGSYRVPEAGLGARPVHLVDDAGPIT